MRRRWWHAMALVLHWCRKSALLLSVHVLLQLHLEELVHRNRQVGVVGRRVHIAVVHVCLRTVYDHDFRAVLLAEAAQRVVLCGNLGFPRLL